MRSSFVPILLPAVCYLLQVVDSQEGTDFYCSPIILPGYRHINLPDQPVLMSYGFSGDQTIIIIQNGLRFGPFDTVGTLEWSGIQAELTEFELKLPAEHHIGPIIYPLELQMKHKTTSGKFLILSLLFQEGDANPVLHDLFYYIDESPAENNLMITHGVNLDRFTRSLGETSSTDPYTTSCTRYLHYNGSLTGDDDDDRSCDGETIWLVLRDPLTVSAEQLAFIKLVSGVQENAASAKLLMGREVLGGTFTDKDYDDPVLAPVIEDSDDEDGSSASDTANPDGECGFFDFTCQPYWHFILIGLAAIPLFAIPVCCVLWCSKLFKEREFSYGRPLQPGKPLPRTALNGPQFLQENQPPVTFKRQVWDDKQQKMRTEVPGLDRIRCDSTGYCWVVGSKTTGGEENQVETRAFLPAR